VSSADTSDPENARLRRAPPSGAPSQARWMIRQSPTLAGSSRDTRSGLELRRKEFRVLRQHMHRCARFHTLFRHLFSSLVQEWKKYFESLRGGGNLVGLRCCWRPGKELESATSSVSWPASLLLIGCRPMRKQPPLRLKRTHFGECASQLWPPCQITDSPHVGSEGRLAQLIRPRNSAGFRNGVAPGLSANRTGPRSAPENCLMKTEKRIGDEWPVNRPALEGLQAD
jgi:hypothetical protein